MPRRPRASAVLSVLVVLSALLARSARAEPPAMKEQQQHPRLEVASADGRYSVAVGGFFQARYAAGFTAGALESSRLGIPRTRLYVFGRLFAPTVRYRLMLGTAPYDLSVQLYDAYLEWWARPWARLRGGYFKVPVLREWVESARLLGSVDRSPGARLLGPGRRPGVMLSGGAGGEVFEYWLGVFGGGAEPGVDAGAATVLAARGVWNTQGRSIEGEVDLKRSPLAFSIGGSGSAAFSARPGGPRARELLGAGELAVRHRGLDGALELAYRERHEGASRERVVAGYARANYFIPRARTAIGLRAAQVLGLDDPARTRSDLELDLGALIDGHDLKLQLSAGPGYLPGPRRWDAHVQVQIQAAF